MLILLNMKIVSTFNSHFSQSQAFQIPSAFQCEFLKSYNVKPITIITFALTPCFCQQNNIKLSKVYSFGNASASTEEQLKSFKT